MTLKLEPVEITPRVRRNLERLASALEALPADYKHFDMQEYADHKGRCEMEDPEGVLAKDPQGFLNNCGTVACAVGHAPAAGIPILKREIGQDWGGRTKIDWVEYVERNFFPWLSDAFEFLFGGGWKSIDNHHYGAAARIRFLLAHKGVPLNRGYVSPSRAHVPHYRPFRVDAVKLPA